MSVNGREGSLEGRAKAGKGGRTSQELRYTASLPKSRVMGVVRAQSRGFKLAVPLNPLESF